MDFYQSNSSHDRITRWLICDLRYTELFASRTLYLISRARIEVASSTFSLLFLLFSSSKFFFVLFIQSERCTLDRPARFFPPCLHPFETSTALSARPCTVCLLMETRCSIALKGNFFSWQVPGREGDGSLEWPFVIQWDTNHQGFTRVLYRVPRSKRYDLLSRKLLQITSFFLWFISSISNE